MAAKKAVKKTTKKSTKKKTEKKPVKKKVTKKAVHKKTNHKKSVSKKNVKTLQLMTDHEIATDFAVKAYKEFGKTIKSIVLFGSVEKKKITHNSDVDIIILLDDVSVTWDEAAVAWYREQLELLVQANPYVASLHINTIKLTSWWDGLLKGDPVILNVIRHGQAILDTAGFIEPLKILLAQGKIKGTPETIYQCIQRAPTHLARSKAAELSAVEGVYWSMVDAAHGALIAANVFPPSPEHVIDELKETFVDKGMLKMKYVLWYKEVFHLHKKIDHKEISDLKEIKIDELQNRAEEFMGVMVGLVEKIISKA
jgi:predicted nucleotidyltransferase/uncharacterized protein (UPF0332 family)